MDDSGRQHLISPIIRGQAENDLSRCRPDGMPVIAALLAALLMDTILILTARRA
jgi:hypothetical protein